MRVSLYAHGGSANHGCEALVRSTVKMIKKTDTVFTLLSERPEEDLHYKLDKIARIEQSHDSFSKGLRGLTCKLQMKLTGNDCFYYQNIYRNFIKKSGETDLAVAIGGDNYCYQGFAERFGVLNDMFASHNIPCILWGCSIGGTGKYTLHNSSQSNISRTLPCDLNLAYLSNSVRINHNIKYSGNKILGCVISKTV